MNYEEFSPEARNAIDQFRNFIEEIKSGKLSDKVYYHFGLLDLSTKLFSIVFERRSNMDVSFFTVKEYIYAYSLLNNISLKENYYIIDFIKSKNCFLPTFTSKENFDQNKHKYFYMK